MFLNKFHLKKQFFAVKITRFFLQCNKRNAFQYPFKLTINGTHLIIVTCSFFWGYKTPQFMFESEIKLFFLIFYISNNLWLMFVSKILKHIHGHHENIIHLFQRHKILSCNQYEIGYLRKLFS